ncbi:PTS transporter subunit EIIC [Streptomyces sp. NPDC005799]|uniref:PTS transporter subunit EIIC n=1 Tax=Streptomyces sp. NPDC005799 TaxID=3154678 RepID=UPI0033F90448
MSTATLTTTARPGMAALQRLGRFDGLHDVVSVISAVGGALFSNLPLIFAVRIAIGFAKKSDGSTALATLVSYLVLDGVLTAMSPVVVDGRTGASEATDTIDYGVLGGIIIGLMAAVLWQHFHRTQLPTYLGFFSRRRLVPILRAFVAVVIGVTLSLAYPVFNRGLIGLGDLITSNTVIGGGIFGVMNRLLIPLGLHHILDSMAWSVFGDDNGTQGALNRIFADDPSAGTFMTGFFPIMMFALPAAAAAIWHEARPENRNYNGSIMMSAALTSLVTGFSFSVDLIDYVPNWGRATEPWLLLPIGAAYAIVYHVLFHYATRKWNLRTPGRERAEKSASQFPECAL